MRAPGRMQVIQSLLFLCSLQGGCAALPVGGPGSSTSAVLSALPLADDDSGTVTPVRFQETSAPPPGPAHPDISACPPEGLPFPGMSELSVDALVKQVLARNQSLAEMVAAWQAAQARYPQVTSLEDPMFAATVGP